MSANSIKTFLLLGLLTALILWVGNIVGGRAGVVIALILAVAMNGYSYWYSDKMVLYSTGAQEVLPEHAPEIYGLVAGLARRAGLPVPRVYIVPEGAPNAFATGRDPEHAAVAFTEGILETLNREELEGVAAHELAHIGNRDILIGTVAATLAGAIMYIAQMAQFAVFFGAGRRDDEEGGGGMLGILLAAIVAPVAAMLLQMAVSRSREYLADASAARIAGSPNGLANALGRLEEAAHRRPLECASEATAHMYIVNPLSGEGLAGLFSTHPPMEERIRRLLDMR
ncbi:MAG: zinc metalloprotease HtpX [Nitrospinota bacterium]|nr:zinc metalloprotease HtpX [Nitrospinota bacterium]MDP7370806.1 zinc metalloprotease HtpX [Nitrospinota bacterium]MDP7503467.1 zinc metalloprotease HtpX [Nitrospinota bacterium]MDP7665045.1 zinc metalloprotease HtpX [Nitrospinota bacterium]HJP12826.1 zinc metalloprotease HtpX [Nitrospinota bacterium]